MVSLSKPEMPTNLKKNTSTPDDIGPPYALALTAPVFTFALSQYIKEDI